MKENIDMVECDNPNVMVFDTDDEFTNFCLNSEPTLYNDSTTGIGYYDYEFTPSYIDAINSGKQFMIVETNSKIMKRGCVSRGIITKKVSNLAE